MSSTAEYEQQQFWKDKPIEIILGDNSGWVTEYTPGWDINLTYNKDFVKKFMGVDPPKSETYTCTTLNFNNEK